MSCEIPLTKGLFAIVDESDYGWVNHWRWNAHWGNGYIYAGRKSGEHTILMHRAIVAAQDGQVVDHRNHDTLDNRRENIRVCSQTQNLYNRSKAKNNTSGLIGVYWHKSKNRWCAQIRDSGKRIHIGYFTDKVQAAIARDAMAKLIHGEFAVLNFPEETLKAKTTAKNLVSLGGRLLMSQNGTEQQFYPPITLQ
jgi:hypothetical protein